MMIDGDIAIRVRRRGRWRSEYVSELSYLTSSDIEDLPPQVKAAVIGLVRQLGWTPDFITDAYYAPGHSAETVMREMFA